MATTLGLYAKAKTLSEERQQVQAQLEAVSASVPELLDAREIARRADEELFNFDRLL